MGRLSTHVLDTAHGRPAGGLEIDLFYLGGESRQHLARFETNADGRTDAPLMAGDDLVVGVFELVFHVGNYFAGLESELPDPSFLDLIPIRFGVAHPEENYHVPLLVSPYGYSTYRGS